MFNEPAAALSLRTLSPAMLFSCLMAVLRGYFQGHQQMVPTAISQILEQFFRVGVIFIALFLLAGQALPTIVARRKLWLRAVGTDHSGFTFLAIYFAHYYRSNHPTNIVTPEERESTAAMLKQLVIYAIPISIGALVLSITQFIDSTMDIGCLEASGMAHAEALVQYGYLASYAMPIINLLFIITSAISSSLVPTTANLYELKDGDGVQHNVRTSILLTVIIMLPAAAGLATLGTPICALLYNNAASGAALSYVAFAVVGIGVYQVSSGALQGLGHVYIPMASLIIGALLKIGLNYVLLTRAGADIRMAALATVIAFAVAALHNLYQVGRIVGWKWFSLKQLIVKPVVSTLAMAVCVTLVKLALGGSAFLADSLRRGRRRDRLFCRALRDWRHRPRYAGKIPEDRAKTGAQMGRQMILNDKAFLRKRFFVERRMLMTNAELSPLVEVVERLLAPGGCPWDRAQTHASMRKHMIEEATRFVTHRSQGRRKSP